ncbi:hypothetical protein HYPBUDRAFT_138477 [Hyphopichia burtonii NRRL Y-1933]|uniref:Rab-GAP TBC domain-containing protein n=1 Tax=Hyphopichia burtonii NRRL Y-1933 TaxID=984485 RepID=A0A1E4RLP4_9ASCO|nr:hypothetical protein HYPBUDRAFT_138477 [Hyphopichia burtonii NRRL Y-1933]ODV68188.1 hypothetical protein HYPBUDRAFT_138477 [Hyphopichia burtonii NRRL Y-1933]
MPATASSNSTLLNQLHPDWVDMDIENLGKSFYNSEYLPLSNTIKSLKAKTLQEALLNQQEDILIEYLQSTEGLINNRIRSKVWPILLGLKQNQDDSVDLDSNVAEDYIASFLLEDLDFNDLPPHRDEDQIKLDIQRSFTILSHAQSFLQQSQAESYTTMYSNSDIEELRKKLMSLIIKVLRKYPSLHYYQGYHDIASIILLVCYDNGQQSQPKVNEELAFLLLEKLSVFHLRDFMITDINLSVDHLKLIPTLLECIDSKLFGLLMQASNIYIATDGLYYDYTFYQALSSILTFFSHDINNLHHLLVIWDFSLAQNSVLANIYIYVSFLLHYKEKIFEELNISHILASDEDCFDFSNVDADLLHTLISPASLFSDLTDADLIKILNKTKELIKDYPINELENTSRTFKLWFNDLNKHSVLLNTSDINTDRIAKNEKYDSLLKNATHQEFPEDLSALIKSQDEEMVLQTKYDASVQQRIFEQQESLATSMSSVCDDDLNSSYPLLSSSLSSLSSASSSINTKIVTTSSLLFKKLFSVPSHESDENKSHDVTKRNRNLSLFSNITKISFTIGLIGFLLHFLLVRNHPRVLRLIPLNEITNELSSKSMNMAAGVGNNLGKLFNYIATYGVVNRGLHMGQLGLGNIREGVYGPP